MKEIPMANKTNMTPIMQNVHKEMFEQIRFIKKQQWSVTNYVALIYAAVFALGKSITNATVFDRAGLSILVLSLEAVQSGC